MENLSPMMQQYRKIKNEYNDHLLFYRLGDFYEMFFDDAILGSSELDITLTQRDCGNQQKAPMCGVPFHAADTYINRLINKGYKIAICEQVEDPKDAVGIVHREVVQVITPGTITNTQLLDEKTNNYLCSIYKQKNDFGISCVDITTGDLFATLIESNDADRELLNEISRYNPSEILINSDFDLGLIDKIKQMFKCRIEMISSQCYEPVKVFSNLKSHFEVENVRDLNVAEDNLCLFSISAILQYLEKTQFRSPKHIHKINYYEKNIFMDLDYSTKKDLELTSTIRENKKAGSLIWVLDKTKTSMGARLLRNWFERPLTNIEDINDRLNAVKEFKDNRVIVDSISDMLLNVKDIERLSLKISSSTINPREVLALGTSVVDIPLIIKKLKKLNSNLIKKILNDLDPLLDIKSLIERAIDLDAPMSVTEGGIIKEGFNEEADTHRKAVVDGKKWILQFEEQEKQKTGIKNLKIGYNRNFGYYFEVTKSNLKLVPLDYTRKQTLINCERFVNSKLKTLESIIIGAQERLCRIENELFCQIRETIGQHYLRIYKTAKAIATLDVLMNFALVAETNNYVMPSMTEGFSVDIKDGRHPVVEAMQTHDYFVPNDLNLDDKNSVSIITGPNMAGKSTYMRQNALIVLMAQIGSFVPVTSAKIGIVDKIFTRIGAWDDLAAGQSTFMVEMKELANIIENATKKSFLILDEIGRGTSTHDGLSIAWAVLEYISDKSKLGAKTLFATHYHELTKLADKIPHITNYSIATRKEGDDITFLRKILKGISSKSYGIEVAKLAGIKHEVISRAHQIAHEINIRN